MLKILLRTKETIVQKGTIMRRKAKLIAALKIWVVIYPSITLFLALFSEPLAALHLYQRTFLLTVTLVPWIVFIALPLLDVALTMISPRPDKQLNQP